MIQNVSSCPYQCPQQAWALDESGLEKQDSIQKNRIYSYTSSEMIEVQYISLDSSSDPSKALDLFFSNLKEALTGVIDFENSNKLFPYSNTDTPEGFAGNMLNRIQEQVANINALVIPPAEDMSVSESELPQAVQMEERNEPAEISQDQTQAALAEEIQVQPVVYETKQQLLNAVENGVSKGFQETVSYLSQSVFREQSIQTVEKADQFIKKGIQSLRSNQPALQQENRDMLEIQGKSESRELNLEILTKDGDRVKIEINMDMMSELVRYQHGDEGKKIRGKQISDSTEDSLYFSIQGELNPEELNAISDLIGEITTLADKFYSGNFQDALNQAVGMGDISNELSGFTLDLKYERSAYAAYITPETRVPAYENRELAQPASGDYLGALKEDVQKLSGHQGFALFEKPLDLFKDIFLALQEPIESVSPEATHQNPDLVTQMLEKALSREGDADEVNADLLNLPSYRAIDYFS